jgi:WD40 repeat protein
VNRKRTATLRQTVVAIAFHPHQSKVFYGDYDAVVTIKTKEKREEEEEEEEEEERIEMRSIIWSIQLAEDGRSLFVSCSDWTGRIVDLQTKKVVTLCGHNDTVRSIIGCDDTDVLTCSGDETIRRWNRSTGECIRSYLGHSGFVRSIAYDMKTKRIFSGSDDDTVMVWNAETGERIGVMTGHRNMVNSIAFINPDTIVSGSYDNTVKIWNATTLRDITTISYHTHSVASVSVTPDREYVVSGSWDKTVKVSSLHAGECVATLAHNDCIATVAVSPDGRFIASGDYSSELTLFSVVPPFPFIVHEGPLSIASQSDHRLLSDGSILSSDGVVCSLRHDSICSLVADDQIHVKLNETSANMSHICLSAPSVASAQLWLEVIWAVQKNLALPSEMRSYSSKQMISRYRFDLLQVIISHTILVPKDVMQLIGNYVIT